MSFLEPVPETIWGPLSPSIEEEGNDWSDDDD
jgi:hypothetical protein